MLDEWDIGMAEKNARGTFDIETQLVLCVGFTHKLAHALRHRSRHVHEVDFDWVIAVSSLGGAVCFYQPFVGSEQPLIPA